MYESYFGLTERPFSIAPDPDYLYMSSRHKEAMAHLSYGLSQGGCFIVLTGEVGTGKTTLCRNLLTDLPSNVDVALILNANLGSTELLQTVCDELKITYKDDATQKQLLDLINAHLLQTFSENRHTVLIIDEAQLLNRDVLEQIRLLTNLETTKSKLLQIILIGQPELYTLLSRNDLRQLAQRVTARYHLGALQRSEIEEYVNCRLSVAGCKQPLFSRQALNKMHALTGGIPRKINVLADQALLATYSQNKALVEAKTVIKTAKEVFITTDPSTVESKSQGFKRWYWVALALVALSVNAIFWLTMPYFFSSNQDENAGVIYKETVTEQVRESSLVVPDASDVEALNSAIVEEPLDQTSFDSDAVLPLVGSQVEAVQSAETDLTTDDALAIEDQNIIIAADVQAGVFNEDTPLGRALDVSGDVTGRITGLRKLASQWGIELPNKLINPVCDLVVTEQLRCLGVDSWLSVLGYNRPAVILVKHNNQRHRVIVQSFVKGRVALLIGDTVLQVSEQEIEQRWAGSGLVFWRPSLSDVSFLKLGDEGVEVGAVRLQLTNTLRYAELAELLEPDSLLFNQDMHDKVTLLQRSFSLIADGVVGNETYLLMNELVNGGVTPVLQQRKKKVLN